MCPRIVEGVTCRACCRLGPEEIRDGGRESDLGFAYVEHCMPSFIAYCQAITGLPWNSPGAALHTDRILEALERELRIACRELRYPVNRDAYRFAKRSLEHTRALIPEHADVANALGAAVNGVVQRVRVLVRPHDVAYRFHLPDGVADFQELDHGIEQTRARVTSLLTEQAARAGAAHPEVHMTREDRMAPDGYGGDGEVFVESELVFTAMGAPALPPAAG